jgi:hypothetical protein
LETGLRANWSTANRSKIGNYAHLIATPNHVTGLCGSEGFSGRGSEAADRREDKPDLMPASSTI